MFRVPAGEVEQVIAEAIQKCLEINQSVMAAEAPCNSSIIMSRKLLGAEITKFKLIMHGRARLTLLQAILIGVT